MENLKKLNEETKAALVASITASKAVTDLIAQTKAAEDKDSGTFRVIISTSDIDRQGESVDQKGWDLTFFKMNPIVLWAHDYAQLPIGVATSVEVKDGKLVAEGKFAPADANPFAQQVRKLYDLGMVNTTSVGFIPKEYDGTKSGVISKSELLEFSFVPVPANPYAVRLSQVKEFGIDLGMLRSKGLEVKEEPEPTPPAPTPEPTPAPAPAAEPVAPASPAAEEKGEVAEQVADMAKREQKWKNYMQVCDVMDAFCSAYFDDQTPVEDFSKLLGETAALFSKMAGGNSVTEDTAKMLNGRNLIKILNHLALGSLKLSDGKVEKTNITPSSIDEVNAFVETRELLRGIDKIVEKALENFNKVARDRRSK